MKIAERTNAVQVTLNIPDDLVNEFQYAQRQTGGMTELERAFSVFLASMRNNDFSPVERAKLERARADVRAGRTTSDEDMQSFFDDCERELQAAAINQQNAR